MRAIWRGIPPRAQALIDYYVLKTEGDFLAEPLNGQEFRQRMVRSIVGVYEPELIVETGTYRGSSTAFFAGLGAGPVHTVEAHPRHHHYARHRLRHVEGVRWHLNDSRSFLREAAEDPAFEGKRIFFYLDAHWAEDLPLHDEVETIVGTWPDAVMMVDDFEVPGDAGYRFDDYGPGKRLCADYLADIPGLHLFFPAASSSEETGIRRGSVVIARDPAVASRLADLDELRTWSPAAG